MDGWMDGWMDGMHELCHMHYLENNHKLKDKMLSIDSLSFI